MRKDPIDLFPCQKIQLDGETQRLNRLALSRVRGIGEASRKAFLNAYIDLRQVWDASPAEGRRISSEARLKLSDDVRPIFVAPSGRNRKAVCAVA